MKILLSILLSIYIICPPYVQASGPDGYLIIESINLYKSIGFVPDSDLSPTSHFYDLTNLNYGIAHLEHTMWGNTSGGRTILVGHTPGGFSNLEYVMIDDEIKMLMGGEEYTFVVFEKYKALKSNNAIFDTTPPGFELVLVTCVDTQWRLIIKAK